MTRKTINLGGYYRKNLILLYKFLVPKGSRHVQLKTLKDSIPKNINYYILDNLVGDLEDVQDFLLKIHKKTNPNSRIIITYYNHFWEPILKLSSYLGLRQVKGEQNWLDNEDLANLLNLSGFEVITRQRRLLLPIYIPILSSFINSWLAHFPIFNSFCLSTFIVARPKQKGRNKHSVSIIVPAKNEAGNIPKIISSIPRFGKWQEIIFVEGHSQDNTWGAIQEELKDKYPKHIKAKAFKQSGKGKADAVRLGFSKAKGEVLLILDADLTVNPKELKKFYEALSMGIGEFANGNRLVYPMEAQAMQALNKFGNKMFSILFTWILGQRFKDTLCGTKALFRKDYKIIEKDKRLFKLDPFGDFHLIFGAIKQNLKVIEIPVRYRERTYGRTNIERLKHGLMLARMTWVAFRTFKF